MITSRGERINRGNGDTPRQMPVAPVGYGFGKMKERMKTGIGAKALLLATALAGSGLWGGERITSLECWGKRAAHDFTAESFPEAPDELFSFTDAPYSE